MENIITVTFKEEGDAYRAFSELKRDMVNTSCTITQMALVKKKNGQIITCEGFDTGITTTDDTYKGGLIGMLVGILGGPLGMLLGGSVGALIGTAIDSNDSNNNLSLIEEVSRKLNEDEVALVALVMETGGEMLDARLEPYQATILRQDAAAVAQEIEEAKKLQKEMETEARARLRETKKEEKKQEIEDKRQKIRTEIEAFRNRFNTKN
ncbi:MAG: DUF1269 domain-containing protein [Lachnospiraceae bacterium]